MMRSPNFCRVFAVLAGVFFGAVPAGDAQTLFQPDGMTTNSFFGGGYVAGNASNGSGMPAGFSPGDAHATYAANNHWTTAKDFIAGAELTCLFDEERTIGTFYLWNHRSNGVASNAHYAVTRFDLEFFDADGVLLRAYRNQAAEPGVATAQAYPFNPVSGVRSVRFTVLRNLRMDLGLGTPSYTGLAEVAFSEEALQGPEPDAAYISWATAAGLDPAGNGGVWADADGDGLVNLIEYALGSPPDSGVQVNLPEWTLSATHLSVSYTIRRDLPVGFGHEVEYSTDLSGWTAAAPGMVESFTISGRGEVFTVSIPRPGAELFARLRLRALP